MPFKWGFVLEWERQKGNFWWKRRSWAADEIKESREDASMGCIESQVSWNTTAIPAWHKICWHLLSWWGWILSFICALWKWKKKKSSLSLGKGGNNPKCAAVDGSLTSSSMDVKGLFPHFLEDGGRVFGVVMMFSLLCSLLREPLGVMWDFWGGGRQIPPFLHPLEQSHVADSCLQHF